jgi:hypothetical protein
MSRLKLFPTFILAVSTALQAEDWPHWRGPTASGVSTEVGLPIRWSETENVAWKARIRGLGVSTPIVWGDRVVITSQAGTTERPSWRHPTLVQSGSPAAAGERPLGDALDARQLASLAISGGRLFIRGDDSLYAIGK